MAAKKKKSAVTGEGTKLPPKGDPDTLYVIDISGYIYRAYHALPPLSSSRGEPTHAVRGVTTMVMKLLKERDPKMLCVAIDSKKGSFRRDIYGKYKANRPPPPEDLAIQIKRVFEVCEAFGIPLLGQDGMEADDAIATVVERCRAEKRPAVVVSADKDLLQLVGDGVVMWDTMRETVFGVPETVAKFGVEPKLVRDLLALTGDKSDNVPGVPSVGPKTASKLLIQYGDFEGLYANLDKVKGKVKEKLRDHEDDARLSRELVSLRYDVDLEWDLEKLAFDGGDGHEIRRIFAELEFTRLLAQLDPTPTMESKVRLLETVEELEMVAVEVRKAGQLAIETVLSGTDPLTADIVGIGLAWVEGISVYVPVSHRYIGVPTQMSLDDAQSVLAPLLENSLFPKFSGDLKREDLAWGRRGVTFRGGRFDVALASYLYDPSRHGHSLEIVARAELDGEVPTMAKLTKSKKQSVDELEVEPVSEVAGARADYVLRLTNLLRPRMEHGDFHVLFDTLEIPLAHVLADMERIGVAIDASILEKMSVEAGLEIDRLEKKAHELAGQKFNVGSPRALETILFDELKLPVIKKTKTARSTDASVLNELASQHPLPEVILELRSMSKLKGTYLDALPLARHPETGRIHTRYNQAVAQTGRLSSSDPNLQNIPIRTEMGRRVRDAFVPRDGCWLLAADYSQIELRVLAHLSQDPELIDAYSKNEDVHVRTASAIFDIEKDAVTREQRGQAKTVNFAVIYGQTQWALAQNLRITKTEARGYIDAFFERYAGVQRFMDEIVEEARATGYVTTLLGRRRALADIRSKNPALRHGAERIARNTPIQGTAADIIKVAMVRLHAALRKQDFESRMILTVHDELLLEVPEAEKERVEPVVRSVMEGAMEISVPLVADVGWGKTWGAAH